MLISTMWTNEERAALGWSYECCAEVLTYEYYLDSERAHKAAEGMNAIANLLHKPHQWRVEKVGANQYWVVC